MFVRWRKTELVQVARGLIVLIFGSCVLSASYSPESKWKVTNVNGSISVAAEVPGCVHTALLKARLIEDPYYRFNDLIYGWISHDNWTYSTTFSLQSSFRQQKRVNLILEGIDTVATVSVNKVLVGNTNNMFLRYSFDVTDVIKEVNVLEIAFTSAVTYAAAQWNAHTSYPVPPVCSPPVQKGECHVNFIRKEQCSFSWDWGPSFPTQGIWKPIEIAAFDIFQLVYLTSVPSYDLVSQQWSIEIEVYLELLTLRKVEGNVIVQIPKLETLELHNFILQPGESTIRLIQAINESVRVDLWWPRGLGEQNGYDIVINISMNGHSIESRKKVYFRSVELIQEPVPGSAGLSFYFKVNGRAVFIKGSNWIPADSFQDRVTLDILRNLLQSAVDANMNTLRVWGGGVYEQDEFYKICDELGIMIWQDFMFACAFYPVEESFLETVRKEITHQLRRLKSHPSIIIWSANNENEAAVATNWFSVPSSTLPIYMKDYVTLYVNNIRGIIINEDKSRPFLSSSPTNGQESIREGWIATNPYDTNYGDTHFYNYTNDCWDWKKFPKPRFASEYGFQSWPSFSTLQKISIPEDWDFISSFTDHRQHHLKGNKEMIMQAYLHYSQPMSKDPLQKYKDTLYLTQVMQAQCIKIQTEFYRRSRNEVVEGKGHTMGALYWQLNDIWQAPSWSSIEYGGKWKMLHYFAKSFFAPVLPVGFEDDGTLHIYAISDLPKDLQLQLLIEVYQWSSMDPVCSTITEILLVKAESAHPIYKESVSSLLKTCGNCTRERCVVVFSLQAYGKQYGPNNHVYLSSLNVAEGLKKPQISAVIEQRKEDFIITLKTAAIAPYVWLDVGDIPGQFDTNGFLMLENLKNITFLPWKPTTIAEMNKSLQITSLMDIS
ncbi:beta-mannosidase [Polypterus senegalus]